MNTKQELLQLFQPLTGASSFSSAAIEAAQAMAGAPPPEDGVELQRPGLTSMVFEQKWTDMVMGELQEQIGVSCMEQGRLLFALRKRYAHAFNTVVECHREMSTRLGESRRQRERLGQTLVDTKASLSVHEEQAVLQQEAAVQQARDELSVDMDKEKKKAQDAKVQMERTQDTLRTLNGIFLQMQKDADGSRIADLRDAVGTMEREWSVLVSSCFSCFSCNVLAHLRHGLIEFFHPFGYFFFGSNHVNHVNHTNHTNQTNRTNRTNQTNRTNRTNHV